MSGIVNNEGQWPMAREEGETFLGTGPMCRYAGDLLPMLKVIVKGKHCDQLKLDQPVSAICLLSQYSVA